MPAEKTKKKRKRKVVGDASGSTFPPKRLREDHHATASHTGGKSLAAIRNLVPDGSSVSSGVTKPPTVVSVPPTPDDGPTDYVCGLNLRTCPPSLRYVVSSDDSHHSGSCSEVKSFVRSPAADALVTTVFVTTTITADASAVLPLLAGPMRLRAMDYDQLCTEFNIGAARQVYLGEERETPRCHPENLCCPLKESEAAKLFVSTPSNHGGSCDATNSKLSLMDLKGERHFALRRRERMLWCSTLLLISLAFTFRARAKFYKVAILESRGIGFADQNSLLKSASRLFKVRIGTKQDEQSNGFLGNRVAI
ncbi:hypothetical protein Tco_0632655 [Tanacetum coccineum]